MTKDQIDTRPVLEREPWQVPLWDAINSFRDARNVIQREKAVVDVNNIVRSLQDRARAAEESFRAADLRAVHQNKQHAAEIRALEGEIDRLTGAIETLVLQEVISAGRARELHCLTVNQQRALWRKLVALEAQ